MAKRNSNRRKAGFPRVRKHVILMCHVLFFTQNGLVADIKGKTYVFQNRDIALRDFGRRAVISVPLYLAMELDIERFGVRVFEIVEPEIPLPLFAKKPR